VKLLLLVVVHSTPASHAASDEGAGRRGPLPLPPSLLLLFVVVVGSGGGSCGGGRYSPQSGEVYRGGWTPGGVAGPDAHAGSAASSGEMPRWDDFQSAGAIEFGAASRGPAERGTFHRFWKCG
jgi:hypothetical protein